MTQDGLLKLIAESGYNIGYAAKKHLATFDIVEKVPGWIGLVSFAVGLLALYEPNFEQKHVSAGFLIIGVASLFINFYQNDKDKYAKAGGNLTGKFHELRVLYQEVKSQTSATDMTPFLAAHKQIQDEALELGLSKQIFMSDWYAHYKFFWQMQIGWIDEQLKFRFFRDKVPLSAIVVMAAVIFAALSALIPALAEILRSLCR